MKRRSIPTPNMTTRRPGGVPLKSTMLWVHQRVTNQVDAPVNNWQWNQEVHLPWICHGQLPGRCNGRNQEEYNISKDFLGFDIQEALNTTVQSMTTTQAVVDSSYYRDGHCDRDDSGNIIPSFTDLRNHVATIDTKFSGCTHFYLTIVSKSSSGRISEYNKRLKVLSFS